MSDAENRPWSDFLEKVLAHQPYREDRLQKLASLLGLAPGDPRLAKVDEWFAVEARHVVDKVVKAALFARDKIDVR